MPVPQLKALLALLGRYRYNVFHWHATDTQAFQWELQSHPELSASGGTDLPPPRYRKAVVRELVAYGRTHGVSIVPELEVSAYSPPRLQLHMFRLGCAECIASFICCRCRATLQHGSTRTPAWLHVAHNLSVLSIRHRRGSPTQGAQKARGI